MYRGAWQATVHGITELDRTEQLTHTHTHTHTHTPILVAAAMVASAVTALSENKYPTTRPNKHFLTISQQ